MKASYSALVEHEGLCFTGQGQTDHEAVTKAVQALEACWSINISRARLTVRLGDSIQYTTTVGRYNVATQ